MDSTLLPWLMVAPSLVMLAVVLFNLAAWPRGRADGRLPGRVSVLIPARNEEEVIEACVLAALASTRPPDEVIVCDDGSTDATLRILARLVSGYARVRVIQSGPLPAGWVGKPHACHRLAEAARGDVLVYVDADTLLTPEGLARLGSVFASHRADVVTAGTRQEVGSFAERLVVPLLQLTYLAWLPLPLVWRSRDPRMLVANGQLMAVRRPAYDALGGWQVARSEVVDDMAFCRAAKSAGLRVVFADGFHMASSRMYRGFREVWEGFSKNLYEGIGGRAAGLAVVIALHAWVFLASYGVLVAAALGAPGLWAPGAAGVGANLLARAAMVLRLRQPAEGILLHPLSILALLGIAVNSLRWSRGNRIRWRGRVYAARDQRETAGASGPRLP
jgi:chlorobactene glucosyltransferase